MKKTLLFLTIIISTNTLPLLDQSEYLTLKRASKDDVQYILASSQFSELLCIQENLKKNENIISYQLNK